MSNTESRILYKSQANKSANVNHWTVTQVLFFFFSKNYTRRKFMLCGKFISSTRSRIQKIVDKDRENKYYEDKSKILVNVPLILILMINLHGHLIIKTRCWQNRSECRKRKMGKRREMWSRQQWAEVVRLARLSAHALFYCRGCRTTYADRCSIDEGSQAAAAARRRANEQYVVSRRVRP